MSRMHADLNALLRLRSLVSGRSAVIGVPYLWLLVFFLLPFLIVFKISVSEMETVQFKDLITLQGRRAAAVAEAVELRLHHRGRAVPARPTWRA